MDCFFITFIRKNKDYLYIEKFIQNFKKIFKKGIDKWNFMDYNIIA